MKEYKNVAFAPMRMQGFHNGHYRLISQMLRDNDLVIIGLGSTQIKNTLTNPYSVSQRMQMIKTVFGDTNKIKIVPLVDLGAVEKETWVNYCLKEIEKKQLPTPNRYYSGSETDASWFKNSKNLKGEPIEIIILNRFQSGLMSATDVRKAIANAIINPEMTEHEWKPFVPECLHNFLIENFPEELTLKFNIEQKGNDNE